MLLLEKVFLLEDFEVILTGDSAGGNICLAVLNWALMNKIYIPSGLLLCYPVCNINKNIFTPSLLFTLHDYLLTFNSLNLFYKCYLDENCDPINDFALRFYYLISNI